MSNVTPNIPVSELLHKAADAVESRGWSTGTGWNYSDGSPVCLEGGILAALGITEVEVINTPLYQEFVDCPAYQAVREYLNWEGELWRWNDRLAEGGSHVVEVLRAAAEVQHVKERAAVRIPLPRA